MYRKHRERKRREKKLGKILKKTWRKHRENIKKSNKNREQKGICYIKKSNKNREKKYTPPPLKIAWKKHRENIKKPNKTSIKKAPPPASPLHTSTLSVHSLLRFPEAGAHRLRCEDRPLPSLICNQHSYWKKQLY